MRVQDSLFYVLYYLLMKKEVNWIFHEMLLWAKKIYMVFHKQNFALFTKKKKLNKQKFAFQNVWKILFHLSLQIY